MQHQILSEPFRKLLWQEGQDEFDSEQFALVSEEFQKLVNLGLDENVAFFLNRGALRNLTSNIDPENQLRIRLNEGICEMVEIAPIDKANENGGVSVFVGPTGVGKTTTIAKLAARFALNDQKRVRLLTLDTYRIAAAEQLKIYGEIIGVPVRVISSPDELAVALSQCQSNDCVLVDTTGHSHKKVCEYMQLAEYLADQKSIRKHLVLSATTHAKDLQETIDSFDLFSPDGLVFTKLDEASSYGLIVN
jgi:flagellar biosynthesis protein FlhF